MSSTISGTPSAKRWLLLVFTLALVTSLCAGMAYVVADALLGRPLSARAIGLVAFPITIAAVHVLFSRKTPVRQLPSAGVFAAVIGVAAAKAGSGIAVVFGSAICGTLLYVLGWMLLRLPVALRRP